MFKEAPTRHNTKLSPRTALQMESLTLHLDMEAWRCCMCRVVSSTRKLELENQTRNAAEGAGHGAHGTQESSKAGGPEATSWGPPLPTVLSSALGFPSGAGGREPACQCRRQMQVRSLGREDPLEEEMATHSRILAWRISWTGESGGLQTMG